MYQRLLTVAQERLRKEKLSDYSSWVRAVWVNSRGKPLSFDDRPYLVGIYQDQYPNIVYTKSAQIGVSERLISEAVWLAEQRGLNSMFVTPAQSQLQDFVQARLNPVLEMSEYLRTRIEDDDIKTRKLGLKKIGRGHIYFRGSQNQKQIISVDADMVMLDERDRFVEDNVPFIDKRLLASVLKWRREASTPTLPNWGIHKAYLESDQRVWQVQCKKCKLWQEIDFFKSVDMKDKICRCVECKKPIDRLSSTGRWFIQNPSSLIHGYKISGLYNPMATIPDLVKKYRKAQVTGFSALQQFFNQDLGLPYEVEGQRITVQELDACQKDYLFPFKDVNDVFAGVDVGPELSHVTVLKRKENNQFQLIWAGNVGNFFGPQDSIEQVMRVYNVKVCVIDKKPETSKVQELITMFPGKVYAAIYSTSDFSVQEYTIWDDIKFEVRLDRTISLDYLIADIQNKKLELPRNINTVSDFYDQLRASTRITEKNNRGQNISRWIEKGADHYFHSLNYARVAQSRGVTGEALLNYYSDPEDGVTPGFMHWLRANAVGLKT